jgi:hypothetical protein
VKFQVTLRVTHTIVCFGVSQTFLAVKPHWYTKAEKLLRLQTAQIPSVKINLMEGV